MTIRNKGYKCNGSLVEQISCVKEIFKGLVKKFKWSQQKREGGDYRENR
jgi:hypothetical protein